MDRAITEGTLSDTDAIAELHRRRDIFECDDDLQPGIRKRGLVTFNTGIATATASAIANGEPVVAILQQVLKAIGLLYLENEQQKGEMIDPVDEDRLTSDQDEGGPEQTDALNEASGGVVLSIWDEQQQHTNDRLDAAVAARRKRKLLTHGPPKKAVKISRHSKNNSINKQQPASQTGKLPFTPLYLASDVPQRDSANTKQSHENPIAKISPSKPSNTPRLVVKLKVPTLSKLLFTVSKSTMGPKTKYGRPAKSAEYVTSDMESDREVNMDMRAPVLPKKKLAKKRTITPAKPPSPPHQQTPSDDSWESASSSSLSSASSTASDTSSTAPTPSFPPFPKMPGKDVDPFHRGAQIALENVLEDHAEAPDESLLELVTELEENRPIVRDAESKTVLKGGTYVYEALKGVWEDAQAKGLEKVSVKRVVRQLKRLVDAEYARVRKD